VRLSDCQRDLGRFEANGSCPKNGWARLSLRLENRQPATAVRRASIIVVSNVAFGPSVVDAKNAHGPLDGKSHLVFRIGNANAVLVDHRKD
jgi:hypothetical protein